MRGSSCNESAARPGHAAGPCQGCLSCASAPHLHPHAHAPWPLAWGVATVGP
ncbi:hypothetical protein ACFPRL_20060 [Pseudoclavibacter helvolus]